MKADELSEVRFIQRANVVLRFVLVLLAVEAQKLIAQSCGQGLDDLSDKWWC